MNLNFKEKKMAVYFDLDFIKGGKPPSLHKPVAGIRFLKERTPDCLSLREIQEIIDHLHSELEEIRKKATSKFAVK